MVNRREQNHEKQSGCEDPKRHATILAVRQ